MSDDTHRLAEMIGYHIIVDLAQRAFLGTDTGGEIAEMIGGERNIGVHRLADRLAVVAGFDMGKKGEIILDPVGDQIEYLCPVRDRGAAPALPRGMGGIKCKLHILGARTCDFAKCCAVDGAAVGEIAALDRRLPLSTDEIVVAGPQTAEVERSVKRAVGHDVLLFGNLLPQAERLLSNRGSASG